MHRSSTFILGCYLASLSSCISMSWNLASRSLTHFSSVALEVRQRAHRIPLRCSALIFRYRRVSSLQVIHDARRVGSLLAHKYAVHMVNIFDTQVGVSQTVALSPSRLPRQACFRSGRTFRAAAREVRQAAPRSSVDFVRQSPARLLSAVDHAQRCHSP